MRPIGGYALMVVGEQKFLRAAAVGRLAVEAEAPVAIGGVGDPLAIGRPDRRGIRNRSKGESGANPTRQIEHPDVVHPRVDLERDAISLRGDAGRLQIGERKSTRLNSSHLVISYAVFCLKKKRQ